VEAGLHKITTGMEYGVSGGISWEWNVNWFNTDRIFNTNGMLLRTGTNRVNEDPLMNLVSNARFKHTPMPDLTYAFLFRYRYFLEKRNMELDYLPSPYIFSMSLQWKTISNLKFSTLSHFVGPKEVRHWTEDGSPFKINEHWEHNISLIQTFFREKLRFHYSTLHAFGKEIREHPNEGPFRFRILVGCEYVF
jgi:hypothetical protein